MTYFSEIRTKDELKATYRRLSIINHPDKGGVLEEMQKINNEYSLIKNTFGIIPERLEHAQIGNFVYVNKSICIVTHTDKALMKVKSLKTRREAIVDKQTGYGLFNLRIKAYV